MDQVKKVKSKIIYKLRGDVASAWETLNPVLAPREPGLILDDSGKTIGFKIGDGTTSWCDLEYHSVAGYVEKIEEGNGGSYQAYAINEYGNQTMLEIEDNAKFEQGLHTSAIIPRRQRNGNLFTNAPIEDLDCANKKYVDDQISELRTL